MRDSRFQCCNRREFVQFLSAGLAGLPLLRFAARYELAEPAWPKQNSPAQSFADAPANLSWRTVMVSPSEPGEPLVISGTIFGLWCRKRQKYYIRRSNGLPDISREGESSLLDVLS